MSYSNVLQSSYVISQELSHNCKFMPFDHLPSIPFHQPASSNHKPELFFMSLVFVPCFFIHSSIDEHIVCFHDLAMVKKCCCKHVDTDIFSSQQFCFLCIYASYYFLLWQHQFTIPVAVSKYSTSSTVFMSFLFDDGHSNMYEVICLFGFYLHFSNDQ